MDRTNSNSTYFPRSTYPRTREKKVLIAMTGLIILAAFACGRVDGKELTAGQDSFAPLTPVMLTNSHLQGVFSSTTKKGEVFYDIALENASFWYIAVEPFNDRYTIPGYAKGFSKSSGCGFYAHLTAFSFSDDTPPTPIQITGNYTASTITQSLIINGEKSPAVNYDLLPQNQYIYNQPASIPAIVGDWPGSIFGNETSTISISSDGMLSGTSSSGCAFKGQFMPRPSGVNIYNVSITYGASPCATPNETASGIALTSSLPDGKKQLIVMMALPSGEAAAAFYGTRN